MATLQTSSTSPPVSSSPGSLSSTTSSSTDTSSPRSPEINDERVLATLQSPKKPAVPTPFPNPDSFLPTPINFPTLPFPSSSFNPSSSNSQNPSQPIPPPFFPTMSPITPNFLHANPPSTPSTPHASTSNDTESPSAPVQARSSEMMPTRSRERATTGNLRTPSPPERTAPHITINEPRSQLHSSVSQLRPQRTRRQSTQTYTTAHNNSAKNTATTSTTPRANENQLEAKVVILGSQGVGKTSIVHRYTAGHFSNSLSSTIGASFLTKKLIIDDCKVRLQIWDTAGQERFRSMAPLYYRGALAAVIVYDITNEESFNDIKIWLHELRLNMSPDLIIHVVGSKADLAQNFRKVSLEKAKISVAVWMQELEKAPLTKQISPESPKILPRRRGSLPTNTNSLPPTITTTAPAANSNTTNSNTSQQQTLESLGARVRKMSTKLGAGLPTSHSMSALPSTSSELNTPSTTSESMSRSGSKLGLSLGLGMTGRSNSSLAISTQASLRKSQELEEEQIERDRLQTLVDECHVTVTEVSAKDDLGIEDLFFQITRNLVERKLEIESQRVLRSRNSILLRENDHLKSTVSGNWCC